MSGCLRDGLIGWLVGAACGTGEDGYLGADVWHQGGARQALPGEP